MPGSFTVRDSMKQTTFTVKYDEEKLNAIRQYMGKKNVDFEGELAEVMGKMYEKYVPQAVREYIDSREETPPAARRLARPQAGGGGVRPPASTEQIAAQSTGGER